MTSARSNRTGLAGMAAVLLAGLTLLPSAALARYQIAPPPASPRERPGPVAPPAAPPQGSRAPAADPLPEIPLTPLGKVEVRGTGKESLILIPDYGMDWRLWESFMERNASRYTMYAINLPGVGGTSPPADMPTDAFYSDGVWTRNVENAILAMMDERKIEKAFAMGQAYGGHLAIRMAMMHPDRIAGSISLDGTVTVELPQQKSPRMPRDRREAFVAATMRAGERVPDDKFFERQKQGLKQAVADPARAEFIASMIDGVPKKVFLQYLAEYFAADLWANLDKLKSPIAVIVPLPGNEQANQAPNKATKSKWSRWFLAAKRQCDVVWFENSLPLVTECAPFELDRTVHAFVHGNYVPGKSRYAKPMTAYVAPEEGGPAEIPRPADGQPRAEEDDSAPGDVPGNAPAEPGSPKPSEAPAPAPAAPASPK